MSVWKATTHSRYKDSENRHLWKNRFDWWIAFTVTDGNQSFRIRRSLNTRDLEEARARRDKILAKFAKGVDIELVRKKKKHE